MLLIARLAVDVRFRGRGLAMSLMRFSFERAVALRHELGCVAVTTDAKAGAEDFYTRLGFSAAPTHPIPGTTRMTLSVKTIEETLR